MNRDLKMEKKKKEEENMCTALFTAFVVLTIVCLKHFSSLSYLIEQWRSLVFLILNVVLLAVYFTSTRPISGETTQDLMSCQGGSSRTIQGKKNKKARMVVKPCAVEETKRACPQSPKKSMDFNEEEEEEEDKMEAGRLSNEELNERVEAFIKSFRKHLVVDARRDTNQMIRSNDSHISFLGREVTCLV